MDPTVSSAELLRPAFQEVLVLPDPRPERTDRLLFNAKHAGKPFLGYMRAVREGRPDRLIPLVAQTVLEVQAHSQHRASEDLVAIVVAPHVSEKAARAAIAFAKEYVPNVVVGVFGQDGRRLFSRENFEDLNAAPVSPFRDARPASGPSLFSDLSQWLLKLLLASHLNRPEYLGAPVARYRNASALAARDAGDVSIMSAFRLIEQLRREGFLHESSPVLRLVRVRELLERWQASYQRPPRELPVQWLLQTGSPNQLSSAVKAYGNRACVALFAAAHAHGFRHVTGVPIHVYVDSFEEAGLQRMGVVAARNGEEPDLVLRIPWAKESVFRAQVMVGRGYRAADILQVWLDVVLHPSRGREQADFIYRRVIEPMLTRP